MPLTRIEESLVLAAYRRGGSQKHRKDHGQTPGTDEILTLSLFYSDDTTPTDCVERFAYRSYVQKLYQKATDPNDAPPFGGKLTDEINGRYSVLINLLRTHPELIEGIGNFDLPTHPTFTSCWLTDAGVRLAETLLGQFPKKPDFPNWPDERAAPPGT